MSEPRRPARTDGKRPRKAPAEPRKLKEGRPRAPGLPPALTKPQLRTLRALAHPLEATVQIGKGGITDALVEATRQALIDHELVKVRLLEACPLDKAEAASELAERARAALVQLIGRVVILYAPHPNHPQIALPKAGRKADPA